MATEQKIKEVTNEAPAEAQKDVHPSVRIKAGTKMITENEMSQKMYVIIKGKARVFKTYLGQRITLAVLGDGEIFGEMSFIDAEPRSASVEALTDMDVIIIDGAKGSAQLKSLPPWVWSIFKTVFHRFRDLDREIVSLYSAVAYRKKSMKHDVVASTIYLEMVRFIKAINLIHDSREQAQRSMKADEIMEEVDGVLGGKAIGFKAFWRLLEEYDFFEPEALRKTGNLTVVKPRLFSFESYLKGEIEKESYMMITHGSLSVLRKIIAYLENKATEPGQSIPISCQEFNVRTIPDYQSALTELEKVQLVPFNDETFHVEPARLHELYVYHSIIKHFDHSTLYVD